MTKERAKPETPRNKKKTKLRVSPSHSPRVSPSPHPQVSQSPRPRVFQSPHPPVSKSPRPKIPLITLLTDFGYSDYFVGSMKGVILGISPDARIVDITHEVPAGDIESAAFTLQAAYTSFPAGSIHVAVVDPGVGSDRRPILVQAGGHSFVGPDNGIFSYVCWEEKRRIFELTNSDYFRSEVSSTFHGRDIFAPAAAALATGIKPSALGQEVEMMTHLKPLRPKKLRGGALKAKIIHIDRFGNCITSLTRSDLTTTMIEQDASVEVNGTTIKSFRKFFSERPGGRKEVFGIWGSAGFLELAAMNDSAAKILKARRGDPVIVTCH